MATIVEIQGLDRLIAQFRKAPNIVTEWMNRAIKAAIFEIEKEAVDENFLFKTPRAQRSGYLQRSFKFGMKFGNLFGEIGPTAIYAPRVHAGNPFMPRIENAAKPEIERHFKDAMEGITKEIAS